MEKLGIELPLLLTQIVNFTIMVLVLTKLLYQPILKALKKRRAEIETGLKAAEKAQVELQTGEQKQQELLAQAREEGRLIIDKARQEAKKQKEEIVAEGKAELEVLKNRQEKELKAKMAELEAELQKQTVDVAAQMTKSLLGELITSENQHELLEKQLTKLEKTYAKRS